MTNRSSLYFPIYKQIEEEVVLLSSSICFNDDQFNVYSLKIAELIIRCSVELESIAKELYRMNNDKKADRPGDCFTWMESNWRISKKKLSISSPYFCFDSLNEFCPFDYQDKSPEDYYSTYCAIKHDRSNNLKKANVYTLIRVLGALFILNVFYLNNRIHLGDDRYGLHADLSAGSSVFVFGLAPYESGKMLSSQKVIDSESCLYRIVRQESEYAFRIVFSNENNEIDSVKYIYISDSFQEYAKRCIGKRISEALFWEDLETIARGSKDAFYSSQRVERIISIVAEQLQPSYSAEVNI